jgi:predicted dehydrogenase
MVRQAAEMVREKKIGSVHKVLVMAQHTAASSPGDTLRCLGPAAESLIFAAAGLRVRSLCASIASNLGEKAGDHVNLMLHLDRPAKGSAWLSQVNRSEDSIQISVLGDAGVLHWRSDECGHLWHTPREQASSRLCRGGPEVGPMATEATRFAAMHPEGAAEALANIYRGMYEAIRAKREGRARKGLGREFPTVQDAARTSRFIEAALESDRGGSSWVEL